MPHRATCHALPLLLAVLLLAAGCSASREMADTRRALERAAGPGRLEHGVTLSLGPATLLGARLAAVFLPDEARRWKPYLRHLYRVEVSTYEMNGPFADSSSTDGTFDLGTFDPMALPALRRGGWQPVVAVREEGEAVWVLYRGTARAVNDLYVVALDEEDVALIRLRGRFDRLMAQLLADREAGLLPEF